MATGSTKIKTTTIKGRKKKPVHPEAKRKSDILFLYSLVSNSMRVSSLHPSLITQLHELETEEIRQRLEGSLFLKLHTDRRGNGLRQTMKWWGAGGRSGGISGSGKNRKERWSGNYRHAWKIVLHCLVVKEIMSCIFFYKLVFQRGTSCFCHAHGIVPLCSLTVLI